MTVAYWADAETLFTLPRGAFWPVPEVRSALVRVARRPGVVADAGYRTFSAMVSRLFGQRRKTLGHTLRAGWGAERARAALQRVGVGEATRVEELGGGAVAGDGGGAGTAYVIADCGLNGPRPP